MMCGKSVAQATFVIDNECEQDANEWTGLDYSSLSQTLALVGFNCQSESDAVD